MNGRHRLIILAALVVALGGSAAAQTTTGSPAPAAAEQSGDGPQWVRPELAWRPPALVHPKVVTLCNCNLVNDQIIVNLAAGQDYILKDHVLLTHPVVIQGGHNVVWIGGAIRPSSGPDIGIQLIRDIGQGGGTIHLEGIYLDGIDGVLTDGIEGGEWASTHAPSGTRADATLQIENVRIDHLSGDSGVSHQDCIQHYGGWKDLRVDHFTCQTLYQGFYLPWEDAGANNQGVLSHWDLRNANLTDSRNATGTGMQTLLHFGDLGPAVFDATSHQQGGNLSNVYLGATQKSLDQETYPNSGTTSLDGTLVHSTVNADGTISWANSWAISGFITPGDPPGGDYVPLGVAGLHYDHQGND